MQPALLRQLLRLALTQSLSRLWEDPGPVVIYVESWMLALFGENGEMLATFQRRFGVSFDLQRVPRCGVLIFINGLPIFQILAALQILTVCFQFQIRRNRESPEQPELASPGNLSKMQIAHPRPTESETLGVGPGNSGLTSSPGDSGASQSVRPLHQGHLLKAYT